MYPFSQVSRVLARTIGLGWALMALGLAPCLARASEIRVQKNVVYGTVNGTKLLLDVYQPEAARGRRPGVVLVHGGGWMGGDKSYYEGIGQELARKGYVAFAINYRLAPLYHYPTQLDDVQRAVRWIRAHAGEYNLDPNRIGALGDSAGGHLVAFLGMRDTRDNADSELARYSSRVQCVVDLYGPTDFTLPASSVLNPQAIQILTLFFGKTQDQAPALYRDGSPILYVSGRAAPFLILHGTADTLVPIDQSQRLYNALRRAGVEATFVPMEKDGHGFLRPQNQQKAHALIEDFFARHLKP
ncbi:MAG TPA: alpha/beta hydrolase [Chthonomonadaceae bacterium]|nr:alpha/beta hydrolase [Chthonomonadaceae bacterium]